MENNLARAYDPVIEKASKMVYLSETVKRLKKENRFLKDVYAAMRSKHMPLLVAKYRLSKLARKQAKKLVKQRKRNRKQFAWLLRKYLSMRTLCKLAYSLKHFFSK